MSGCVWLSRGAMPLKGRHLLQRRLVCWPTRGAETGNGNQRINGIFPTPPPTKKHHNCNTEQLKSIFVMANGKVGLLRGESCWFAGCHHDYSLDSLLHTCLRFRKLFCYQALLSGKPLGVKMSKSEICVYFWVWWCVLGCLRGKRRLSF